MTEITVPARKFQRLFDYPGRVGIDVLGPFGVGHTAFIATNPLRGNRMLAVEAWYPVDAEDRRVPQDALCQRIHEGRAGVVGHSFGGMTAAGMAAGWAGAIPDPRAKAIAPISAVFDTELQSDERTGTNAGYAAKEAAVTFSRH